MVSYVHKQGQQSGLTETETEFITISYWESVEAMAAFAGEDPTRIPVRIITVSDVGSVIRWLLCDGVWQLAARVHSSINDVDKTISRFLAYFLLARCRT